VVLAACDGRLALERDRRRFDEHVLLVFAFEMPVLELSVEFDARHARKLLAVFFARRAIPERDVGYGVAIHVDQGLVNGAVPEFVCVRGRQRIHVQDEDSSLGFVWLLKDVLVGEIHPSVYRGKSEARGFEMVEADGH
jgi:hypothetical protein